GHGVHAARRGRRLDDAARAPPVLSAGAVRVAALQRVRHHRAARRLLPRAAHRALANHPGARAGPQAMSSDLYHIALLARVLAAGADARVTLGIGDDAALLAPAGAPLVWTVDASVEGVHFRRDLLTLADAGYRATMAAASDLAAMGASPLGML